VVVGSRMDRGKVANPPDQTFADRLVACPHDLMIEENGWTSVDEIVEAIEVGKPAIVVPPRGQLEIRMIGPTIEAHTPEIAFGRTACEEATGGLFGYHGAGSSR
jgi:hypothetical protein